MAEDRQPTAGIVSLRLVPEQVVLAGAGASQRFLVLATGPDGLDREVTAQATLSISHPEVASLGPEGKVVSISNGEATLRAELSGRSVSGRGPDQPFREDGSGQLRHRHYPNTDQAGLQWQQLSRGRQRPGRFSALLQCHASC